MLFHMICLVLLSTIATGVAQYCSGGCYRNGICYNHGDTWEDDCSTKRCRQLQSDYAIIETIAIKCKDAYGQCKSHGDVMAINMGGYTATCRCTVGTNDWGYTQCRNDQVNPGTGCDCYDEGICRSFGQRWEKDCFTYECQRRGTSWVGKVIGAACKDANGRCRQNGELMPFVLNGKHYESCKCITRQTTATYQCPASSGGTPGTCSGCIWKGVCHNINSRWTGDDCVIYECRNIGNFWKSVQSVGIKCKDADGYCRSPNQYMSAIVHNRRYEHCYCQAVGMQITYNCT